MHLRPIERRIVHQMEPLPAGLDHRQHDSEAQGLAVHVLPFGERAELGSIRQPGIARTGVDGRVGLVGCHRFTRQLVFNAVVLVQN